jgi:hypothetical protein
MAFQALYEISNGIFIDLGRTSKLVIVMRAFGTT